MRTVVLVPWRGGDPLREANWEITRPYLAKLGPLYVGDRLGPWSRAAACNNASKRAEKYLGSPWDVAIIADADTIPEHKVVSEAVELAHGTGGAVRPHDKLWRLRKQATEILVRGGIEAMHPRLARGIQLGGGLLVISRRAWDLVGGFDERFSGWGHEDSYLGYELVTKASWRRLPGNAWHLWHPAAVKGPAYDLNREMMRTKRAKADPYIRRASQEAGFNVGAVL